MKPRHLSYSVATPAGLEHRSAGVLRLQQGPYIGGGDRPFYSYHIGGYGEFGALDELLAMGRSMSLTEFQDALLMNQLPCFHVIYADKWGNIFYQYAAKVGQKYEPAPDSNDATPGQSAGSFSVSGSSRVSATERGLRQEETPFDYTRPLDANDPRTHWGDLWALQDLPCVINPFAGYVQACDAPPWAVADPSPWHPTDWPRSIIADIDTPRSQRARLLLGGAGLTLQDCEKILFDDRSAMAELMLPFLFEAEAACPDFVSAAHPDLRNGLDLLSTWDYRMDTASTAATYFNFWTDKLYGLLPETYNSESAFQKALVDKEKGAFLLILRAAAEAGMHMRNEFQSLEVAWGDIHRLEQPALALPGSRLGQTLYAAECWRPTPREFPVNYGTGFAQVVEFLDKPRTSSVAPFNNPPTARFAATHDQWRMLRRGEMKPAFFERDEVERHAVRALGRYVELQPVGTETVVSVLADEVVTVEASVAAMPPEALPQGLAPYALFIDLNVQPATAGIEVALSSYISPDLLRDAPPSVLSYYTFDRGSGWQLLESQYCDENTSTFQGNDTRARLYAILGPVETRNVDYAPPLPLEERGALSLNLLADRFAPALADGAEEEEPEAPISLAEAVRGVAIERSESETTPVASEQPTDDEPDRETIEAESEKGQTDAAEQSPRVAWSSEPPARRTSAEESEEAEDGATVLRSKWGLGTDFEIAVPEAGVFCQMTAEDRVRAQLLVTPEPVAELPEGLVAYSNFVAITQRPTDVSADVTITVKVPADRCSQEALEKLALYVLDLYEGWSPLKGQRVNPQLRSFTALDTEARIYAVLGPAGLGVAAP